MPVSTALLRVSTVPYSAAQYCVVGWSLSVDSTGNLRRSHVFLVIDSTLHESLCCIIINFFFHPYFLEQHSLTRKDEPSRTSGAPQEEEKASHMLLLDIPSLWALLCKGDIKLENDFLICPNGACWSTVDDVAIKRLFIRQCYKDLYKVWTESKRTSELIDGTSGIGKSMFIWYALFMLMDAFHKDQAAKKKPLTFLWVTQTGLMYHLYSNGCCLRLNRDAELPPIDYCFIDIGKQFIAPDALVTLRCPRILVIASSYKSEDEVYSILDEARIYPAVTRSMPIWSKVEIDVAAKSILDTDLSTKKLHAIFLIFGGSLKRCLLAYRNVKDDVVGDAPMSRQYYEASTSFVEHLKTSASLASDGIPELVDGLLESNYIIRKFQYARFAYGEKLDDSFLRNACSLIAHTISSAPNYTDGDLRLSSEFTTLYVEAFVKSKELGI